MNSDRGVISGSALRELKMKKNKKDTLHRVSPARRERARGDVLLSDGAVTESKVTESLGRSITERPGPNPKATIRKNYVPAHYINASNKRRHRESITSRHHSNRKALGQVDKPASCFIACGQQPQHTNAGTQGADQQQPFPMTSRFKRDRGKERTTQRMTSLHDSDRDLGGGCTVMASSLSGDRSGASGVNPVQHMPPAITAPSCATTPREEHLMTLSDLLDRQLLINSRGESGLGCSSHSAQSSDSGDGRNDDGTAPVFRRSIFGRYADGVDPAIYMSPDFVRTEPVYLYIRAPERNNLQATMFTGLIGLAAIVTTVNPLLWKVAPFAWTSFATSIGLGEVAKRDSVQRHHHQLETTDDANYIKITSDVRFKPVQQWLSLIYYGGAQSTIDTTWLRMNKYTHIALVTVDVDLLAYLVYSYLGQRETLDTISNMSTNAARQPAARYGINEEIISNTVAVATQIIGYLNEVTRCTVPLVADRVPRLTGL